MTHNDFDVYSDILIPIKKFIEANWIIVVCVYVLFFQFIWC